MNENNGNGSATTVLITVVIVAIIGLAFYFGFYKGGPAAPARGGNTSVDINLPGGNGGGDAGAEAAQ